MQEGRHFCRGFFCVGNLSRHLKAANFMVLTNGWKQIENSIISSKHMYAIKKRRKSSREAGGRNREKRLSVAAGFGETCQE
ncbi:hypothetical protein CEXT_495301 [Caerostris extrusa]|uniref:Uncharacterized protein n=1 Tax=Caerostris extrusa TaxID=172846 RepID=A0AAV4PEX5_CAEEX|nr:hypothetical protein CEXT_495301 [Caerostris extrusa]